MSLKCISDNKIKEIETIFVGIFFEMEIKFNNQFSRIS